MFSGLKGHHLLQIHINNRMVITGGRGVGGGGGRYMGDG